MDGEPKPQPLRGLIDKAELLELVPLSYKKLWDMMLQGSFPRSVVLNKQKIGWFRDEIEAWLEDRSQHHRQQLKGLPEPKVKHRLPNWVEKQRERLNDD